MHCGRSEMYLVDEARHLVCIRGFLHAWSRRRVRLARSVARSTGARREREQQRDEAQPVCRVAPKVGSLTKAQSVTCWPWTRQGGRGKPLRRERMPLGMAIQWYPGHMAKARAALAEAIHARTSSSRCSTRIPRRAPTALSPSSAPASRVSWSSQRATGRPRRSRAPGSAIGTPT